MPRPSATAPPAPPPALPNPTPEQQVAQNLGLSDPEPVTRRNGSYAALGVVGLIVGLIALGSLGGDSDDTGTGRSSSTGSLACGHFRNVQADIAAGILTPGEIRSKMREVLDDAIVDPPLEYATQEMLRGVTQLDVEVMQTARTLFLARCTELGH